MNIRPLSSIWRRTTSVQCACISLCIWCSGHWRESAIWYWYPVDLWYMWWNFSKSIALLWSALLKFLCVFPTPNSISLNIINLGRSNIPEAWPRNLDMLFALILKSPPHEEVSCKYHLQIYVFLIEVGGLIFLKQCRRLLYSEKALDWSREDYFYSEK